MPQAEQWARTRVRTSRQMRRGAWYRVVRLGAVDGILEVNARPLSVPRAFLQILPFRPTMWSVVPRVATAANPPASWGSTYGVCPRCSTRSPLGQYSLTVCCPNCRGLFRVAWVDSGWCVFEARREADGEAVPENRQGPPAPG